MKKGVGHAMEIFLNKGWTHIICKRCHHCVDSSTVPLLTIEVGLAILCDVTLEMEEVI